MWLMLILKVAKNQGFTLTVDDTFLEKAQGGQNTFVFTSQFLLQLQAFSLAALLKKTLVQVFFCEFFKKSFFYGRPSEGIILFVLNHNIVIAAEILF